MQAATTTPPRRRSQEGPYPSPGALMCDDDMTTGSPVPLPPKIGVVDRDADPECFLSPKLRTRRPAAAPAASSDCGAPSPCPGSAGKENVPPKPAAWASPSPARTPARATPAKVLEALLPTVEEMNTLDCAPPPQTPIPAIRRAPPGLAGAERLEDQLPSHLGVKNGFIHLPEAFQSPLRTTQVREFASEPRGFAPEGAWQRAVEDAYLRLTHTPLPTTPLTTTPMTDSMPFVVPELGLPPPERPQQGNILRIGDYLESPVVPVQPPMLSECAPAFMPAQCGGQPLTGWPGLAGEQTPAPPTFLPSLPEVCLGQSMQCPFQGPLLSGGEGPPLLSPEAVLAQSGQPPAACLDASGSFVPMAPPFQLGEQQAWQQLIPQPPPAAPPPQVAGQQGHLSIQQLQAPAQQPQFPPPMQLPQPQPAQPPPQQPQLTQLLGMQPMPAAPLPVPQPSPQHQRQQQVQIQQLQALLGMQPALPPLAPAQAEAPQPWAPLRASAAPLTSPLIPAPEGGSRWCDTPVDALYVPPAPATAPGIAAAAGQQPPSTRVSISASHFPEPGAAAATTTLPPSQAPTLQSVFGGSGAPSWMPGSRWP